MNYKRRRPLFLSRRSNPFRPQDHGSSRVIDRIEPISAGKAGAEVSPRRLMRLEMRRARRFAWLTRLWLKLVIILVVASGIWAGYAFVRIEHEQELRILGRRVRQTETRVREMEIQLQLERQENRKLRAVMVCRPADSSLAADRPRRSQPIWTAQVR